MASMNAAAMVLVALAVGCRGVLALGMESCAGGTEDQSMLSVRSETKSKHKTTHKTEKVNKTLGYSSSGLYPSVCNSNVACGCSTLCLDSQAGTCTQACGSMQYAGVPCSDPGCACAPKCLPPNGPGCPEECVQQAPTRTSTTTTTPVYVNFYNNVNLLSVQMGMPLTVPTFKTVTSNKPTCQNDGWSHGWQLHSTDGSTGAIPNGASVYIYTESASWYIAACHGGGALNCKHPNDGRKTQSVKFSSGTGVWQTWYIYCANPGECSAGIPVGSSVVFQSMQTKGDLQCTSSKYAETGDNHVLGNHGQSFILTIGKN